MENFDNEQLGQIPTRGEIMQIIAEHTKEEGEFLLDKGWITPYYYDISNLMWHKEHAEALINYTKHEVELAGIKYDVVGGLGKRSLMAALNLAADKRMFMIKDKDTIQGRSERLMGNINGDDRVLVVHDVSTRGSAIATAVDYLASYGLSVEATVCIIDRSGLTTRRMMQRRGIPYLPLFTEEELLNFRISWEEIGFNLRWR